MHKSTGSVIVRASYYGERAIKKGPEEELVDWPFGPWTGMPVQGVVRLSHRPALSVGVARTMDCCMNAIATFVLHSRKRYCDTVNPVN